MCKINMYKSSNRYKIGLIVGFLFLQQVVISQVVKASDKIEELRERPIYDYVMNNKIFDGATQNRTKLERFTTRRVELYIFHYIVGKQILLEAELYKQKLSGTMEWHDQMESVIEAASAAADILTFTNDKPIESALAVKGGLVEAWFYETEGAQSSVVSCINEITSKIIKSAFEGLRDKVKISEILPYVLLEGASIANNLIAATQLYGNTEELNTILVVYEYLHQYYNAAGDMNFMANQIGLNSYTNMDSAVTKIASDLSTTNFWGNLNYDKSKAMTRIAHAMGQTLKIFRHYDNTIGPIARYDFTDIPEEAWYLEYVESLYSAGVIDGYHDGSFRPTQDITRAEFIKIVVEANNEKCRILFDPCPDEPSFTDVLESDWFYPYVKAAYNRGWLTEYTTFRPYDPIIRAEATKIIINSLHDENNDEEIWECPTSGTVFADIPSDEWYHDDVYNASWLQLVKGYFEKNCHGQNAPGETYFCPTNNITRAEAAKIVSLSSISKTYKQFLEDCK